MQLIEAGQLPVWRNQPRRICLSNRVRNFNAPFRQEFGNVFIGQRRLAWHWRRERGDKRFLCLKPFS